MRKAGDAARLLRHAGPALIAQLVLLEVAAALLPLAVIGAIGIVVGRVAGGGAVAGPLAWAHRPPLPAAGDQSLPNQGGLQDHSPGRRARAVQVM